MADRKKIISAIEKAKKHSEEYALDRIIVPIDEADMILSLLKGQDAEVNDGQKKLEFIESYTKTSLGDYKWNGNNGELIRCKDCVHWDKGHTEDCENSDSVCFHNGWCKPDFFCADGERKEGR